MRLLGSTLHFGCSKGCQNAGSAEWRECSEVRAPAIYRYLADAAELFTSSSRNLSHSIVGAKYVAISAF